MGRGYKRVPDGLRKRWPRQEAVVETRLSHPKWTARQIADHIGCTPNVVHYCLKRARLRSVRGLTAPKLQPHERQSVADLYAAGEKSLWIATEYGISVSSVRKIAKVAGLPPRQPYGGCRHATVP